MSELCALNVSDIYLDQLPTLTIHSGKGGKCRHIPLEEDDVSILEAWLHARRNIIDEDARALFVALDHRNIGTRLSTRGARGIVNGYL